MNTISLPGALAWRGRFGICAIALGLIASWPAIAQDAAALKARHDSLREQLATNPFQRPIHLESTQTANDLKGDVYAVVEQPYSVVGPALQSMNQWCDLLILHLNVKHCVEIGL